MPRSKLPFACSLLCDSCICKNSRVSIHGTFVYRKAVRQNFAGHAHFYTFSCHQRLPLLTNDVWRGWFVESILHARRELQFELWAYVFMPEHVHLLLRPKQETYSISKFMPCSNKLTFAPSKVENAFTNVVRSASLLRSNLARFFGISSINAAAILASLAAIASQNFVKQKSILLRSSSLNFADRGEMM